MALAWVTTENGIFNSALHRGLPNGQCRLWGQTATWELCGNLGDAARSGGVVYRRFEDLDAVFKSDTCDNLRQVICAFQPSPGF